MVDYYSQLQDYQFQLDELDETIELVKKLDAQKTNPFGNIKEVLKQLKAKKESLLKNYNAVYREYCEEADCLAQADYD